MSKKTNTAIEHSSMGAMPGAKGITFRVWAPHAEKVYVTGIFNDWSKTSIPMAKEENGDWSTDVSEAKTGDEYRYLIHGPKGPLSRSDPYARKANGRLVPTESEKDFSEALVWVHDRAPAERRKLIAEAKKTAKRFSMLRCANKALQLYESLQTGKGFQRKSEETNWFPFMQRAEAEWELLCNFTKATMEAAFGPSEDDAKAVPIAVDKQT